MRKLALGLVVVCAVVVLAAAHWRHAEFWLGMTNASGPEYLAWSGWASDLAELTLLGAVAGIYHKHNCHTDGCWRIGKHIVEGTPWCNRHHGEARALSLPAESPLERKFDVLIESVDGLAEAIRSSLAAR